MKPAIILVAAIVSMNACQTKKSDNQINNQNKGKTETIEKQKIENLLFTYRDAINLPNTIPFLMTYLALSNTLHHFDL